MPPSHAPGAGGCAREAAEAVSSPGASSGHTPAPRRTLPAPRVAVAATAIALVVLNVTVAYAIARAVGVRAVELPAATVLLLAGAGAVAAGVAAAAWRRYLRASRHVGRSAAHPPEG